MALTPVTITFGGPGELVINDDGSPASGGVQFTLMLAGVPVSVTDSSSGETVLPKPVMAVVNNGELLSSPVGGGGYQPVTLIANDDAGTLPVGTYYLVHEELTTGNVADWQFTVHAAAPGGTQSLTSQRP